jgi:hypothetical protein
VAAPASPSLSSFQLATLADVGDERSASVGDVLYRVGDRSYPFIAIIKPFQVLGGALAERVEARSLLQDSDLRGLGVVLSVRSRGRRGSTRHRDHASNQRALRKGKRADARVSWLPSAAEIPFVCECDDSACFGRVQLMRSEYDLLRTRGLSVRLPAHGAESEAAEANGDRHSASVKNG